MILYNVIYRALYVEDQRHLAEAHAAVDVPLLLAVNTHHAAAAADDVVAVALLALRDDRLALEIFLPNLGASSGQCSAGHYDPRLMWCAARRIKGEKFKA